MLIFIDESGDPGFKLGKGSSSVFVVVLVAFRDVDQAKAAGAAIEQLALKLKIKSEFKFSKSRDEVRDEFFQALSRFDFCVRGICIRKKLVYSPRLRGNKESFYSFFVKSMLKFDNGLLKDARIVIDGSGDRSFRQELGSYLRRHLGPGAVREVRFSNSEHDRMVQLADMCAGAVARSYREERSDAARWRKMLGKKIEDIWEFG